MGCSPISAISRSGMASPQAASLRRTHETLTAKRKRT